MLDKMAHSASVEEAAECALAASSSSAAATSSQRAAEGMSSDAMSPAASPQTLDGAYPRVAAADEQNIQRRRTEENYKESERALAAPSPTVAGIAALTAHSFAEMHWRIDRASAHPALRQLQAEWWQCCASTKTGNQAAWSSLKTRDPLAKASEQRDATGLASEDLRQRTVAELRGRLLSMGVEAAPHLYAVVMKLLRSPPGAGRQLLHFDVPSSARVQPQRGDAGTQKSPLCYSCILHLNPGESRSTHMPNLPAAQMEPLFSAAGATWQQQSEHLCHPDHFHSHAMHSGDLLVFRTDVAHYGPANDSSADERWVLFVMFSPVGGPDQDERQEFLDCGSTADMEPKAGTG
jgi:hypothetical protein